MPADFLELATPLPSFYSQVNSLTPIAYSSSNWELLSQTNILKKNIPGSRRSRPSLPGILGSPVNNSPQRHNTASAAYALLLLLALGMQNVLQLVEVGDLCSTTQHEVMYPIALTLAVVARMGISTNATQSMPSPVMNLCEVNSHINMEQLFSAVGWEFLRTCPQSMQDGGHDLISQQYGFQLVNPTEGWFPGLEKSREELASWDWRFGKTPKFTVTRSFRVPEELTEDSMADEELRIKLDINNGIIEDITLQIPPGFMSASGFHGDASPLDRAWCGKASWPTGCRLVSGRRACRVTNVRGAQRATAVSVRGACQAIKLLHGWGGLGLGPNSHEKSCKGSAILGPEGMVAGVESDALVQSGKSMTKDLIVL
uniref:Uncharacterized protein n=1 Tax=Timema douglasi TaxID=61478 RepID=A0A7R8VS89_TIMDO|nr:unnamed protein product [Timema douglasi]